MLPLRTSGRFLTILLSLVLMAPVGMATYGVYGTFVLTTDTDATHTPNVANAAAKFKWNDANADDCVQTTERVYVDRDDDGTVTLGDVRITVGNPAVGTAMQIVVTGAGDLTNALKAAQAGVGCTAGAGALGTWLMKKDFLSGTRTATAGFTVLGKGIYLDLDGNSRVTAGDVRIVAYGGTAGTFVAAEADIDPLTLGTTQYSANTECVYLDSDADERVSDGDTRVGRCGEYLDASTASCATPVFDSDCGYSTFDIPNAKVIATKYYDDLDTAASNLVSNADRRLSPVSTFAESSAVACTGAVDPKVTPGDSDCGGALGAPAADVRFSRRATDLSAPAFLSLDTSDDGSLPEVVFVDIDANGVPSIGDARLNGGAFVSTSDNDAVHELLSPTAPPILAYQGSPSAPTAVALIVDGTSGVATKLDQEDVVLHLSGCTSGTVVRASTTCNPAGAWNDVAGSAVSNIKYRESGSGSGFGTGDTLYASLGATSSNVDSDDVRLTAFSSGAPGTLVGSGLASESGSPLIAVAGAVIRVLDIDGNGVISPGDIPVFDANNDQYLSQTDVPLSTGLSGVAFGTLAAAGNAAVVHSLTAIGTHSQGTGSPWSVKYIDNDGSGGPSLNDPVYLHVCVGVSCATTDLKWRLSANAAGAAAGTFATESAAFFSGLIATAVCTNPIAYGEVGGAGFSSEDDVFVDIAAPCGTLNTADIYLKKSGKAPGTKVGGSDTQGTTLTALATTALSWFDLDTTGAISGGDLLYLDLDSPAGVVSLFDFRMSGSGGTTTLGSTTPPPPPPPPPPTSTTSTSSQPTSSTSSSSTTATTTTSSTTSTTGSNDAATLAGMNQALAESLRVTREAKANVLTWSEQTNALGYQVFSSDSPFVLIATLPSDARSHTDTEGGKSTKYLVTACLATCTLTADQVNDGDVPGYDDTPKGEGVQDKKGFIPAVGPIPVVLAVLAAALVLARRRLK